MIKTRPSVSDAAFDGPIDLKEKMEITANLVQWIAEKFASSFAASELDSKILLEFAHELSKLVLCVGYFDASATTRVQHFGAQPMLHAVISVEPEVFGHIVTLDVSFPLKP